MNFRRITARSSTSIARVLCVALCGWLLTLQMATVLPGLHAWMHAQTDEVPCANHCAGHEDEPVSESEHSPTPHPAGCAVDLFHGGFDAFVSAPPCVNPKAVLLGQQQRFLKEDWPARMPKRNPARGPPLSLVC